ncbi:aldehyde dehydrogenase family protein [Georgenia sp. EYE_87]|uniref:aldehyde dehydrogenase family protein n=1 Tax=Georgenia sp. EYE_87 TaxID=2853448 RepID=UPI0020061B77|nr:aldehyde dehydrogenase family protein [Georgenia sp. EYE_87]MCK6210537.1 aldehyde dehydrogenase family protein [Georgenia sp. EYE_87]
MPVANVLIGGVVLPTEYMPVRNPARTEEVVGHCALGTPGMVHEAIRHAEAAAANWRELGYTQRAQLLRAAYPRLQETLADRANLLTREQGKVLWESVADARGPETIIEYFAGLIDDGYGRDERTDERGRVIVRRVPRGVTAVIVPWNYPIYLACQHLIPALITGNTVVVKPSEYAPLALSHTLAILAEALPKGVLNVVPGEGHVAGRALIESDGVKNVLFTGSVPVGQEILRANAETVRAASLELGGNDPALVLRDAVFDESTMHEMVRGVFTCAGQICFNIKRIYVPRTRMAEFLEMFIAAADTIAVGDGLDARSTMGPLNNANQASRVRRLLDAAREAGATVQAVGSQLNPDSWERGYFMLPHVVSDIDHDHPLVQTEQFGPVVPVLPYDSLDEGIAMANGTEYGLAASVWTADPEAGLQVGERLEAGSVFINTHRLGASDMTMPFGGMKKSGLGRTHTTMILDECTEAQALSFRSDVSAFPGPALAEQAR